MQNANQLFESGKLNNAISALNESLRSKPMDTGNRYLLAEFLCFVNDWERVDKQLEMIVHQIPESLPGILVFRNLVRAAIAREQFFSEGRLPEFSEKPTLRLQQYLKASICIRENQFQEAAELLAQAEDERDHLNFICNGQSFADFRDLDDLTAAVLEIFTVSGQYSWIPLDSIECITMPVPNRSRDLLWRSAHIILRGGQDADVFLPVIYPNFSKFSKNESLQLGRTTEWYGGEQSPVRGMGQRMFWDGEDAIPMLDIQEIKLGQMGDV